jgi:hypothetical protein
VATRSLIVVTNGLPVCLLMVGGHDVIETAVTFHNRWITMKNVDCVGLLMSGGHCVIKTAV